MGPGKPGGGMSMGMGGPAGPQGGFAKQNERPTADFGSEGAGGIRGGGMMSKPMMGGGMAARMGGSRPMGPGRTGGGGFSPRDSD